MNLVAVYGTLKKGHGNHHLLSGSKLLKHSHTGKGFSLFIDSVTSLPYLKRQNEGSGCVIEIYEVDSDTFYDLDLLEGHPHFYTREILTTLDGREVWIYILNSELIGQSGDKLIDCY